MSARLLIPSKEKGDVKDLVITILSSEFPLKLIELTRFIQKRYGRPVTFQAVRKAVLRLTEDGVLLKEGPAFSINRAWVADNKRFIDGLYLRLSNAKDKPCRSESIGSQVSVFTFRSLMEMMRAWEDLSDSWYKSYKKGDYNVNCYQAPHSWEVLTHPEAEARLMLQCKQKGIRAYILCTEGTPLDFSIAKFHHKLGVRMALSFSRSSFDKSYYVGTYGELIIQARYPAELVRKLDAFFRKNTDIETLDLAELSKIANTKTSVKMTVIRDLEMAKHINASIISKMKRNNE